MTPRRYNAEDAEFIQEQKFNMKLFEELLPRFDNRYRQNLQNDMMEDCTSIKKKYEKLSTKVKRINRNDSNLIRFCTTSNASEEASFFEIKFPMPIFTHIPPQFRPLQTILSNRRFLNSSEEYSRQIPGFVENMPCYTLNFNHVSLYKLNLRDKRNPSVKKIGSGLYTKYAHRGQYVKFSSPNILLLGGSNPSPIIDYSKKIIDKCFEYAYWNLPTPKGEKSTTINNLIFHGGRDIYYNHVLKLNKTLIRIIKIKKELREFFFLDKKQIKYYEATVSILVDDGNKISSETRIVFLMENIVNLFNEGDIFTGLILQQNIKQPYYSLVIGSLGKKIESNDLISLISILIQKKLQYLEENSSITYVDKITKLSIDVSEMIDNNSIGDDVFDSSFKLISDFENNVKKSIEELFPLYINNDGDVHQLSPTIISFLLDHDSKILSDKKAISVIIKLLNSLKIDSGDWDDDARSQLRISSTKSNPLTSSTLNLLLENIPLLVNIMVYSRIFSQNF